MAKEIITSAVDTYWVDSTDKLNANFTELYGATLTAGTGFAGTGTIYKTSVVKTGSIYVA